MTDEEQNTLIDIVRTGAELIRLLKRHLEVYGELPDRIEAIEARLDDLEIKVLKRH